MGAPLVSVIIPVYNGAVFLPDAIESIRAQEYAPLEIIVVDDASSDGSAALARSLGADIRVLAQPIRRGPAAARSAGIEVASGDLFVFLDADDLLPAGKLHAQVARLLEQPELDIVSGYVQPISLLGADARTPHAQSLQRNIPALNVNLGASVYRRWIVTGGFDERLPFAEDVDFMLRAEEAGAQMQILRRVTLYYRRHQANVTRKTGNDTLESYFRLVLRRAEERRGVPVDPSVRDWFACLEPAPPSDALRVSVIVPVHNGEQFIAEALASVFAQDYPAAEVLVIDDGSTDDTLTVAQQFDVRCVSQPAQGAAAARSRGLALASGDLIAFLDADDLWEPEKLRRQVEYLQANPQVEYVVSVAQPFAEAGMPQPHPASNMPFLSTLMARRSVFERVGAFDPQYRVASSDDWFTRAQDAAVPYAILHEPLARIRLSMGSLRAADPAAYQRDSARIRHSSIKRRADERKYQL